MVFNEVTFALESSVSYDTMTNAGAESTMATAISSIPVNKYVIVGVMTDAAEYLTTTGLTALRTLGMSNDITLGK